MSVWSARLLGKEEGLREEEKEGGPGEKYLNCPNRHTPEEASAKLPFAHISTSSRDYPILILLCICIREGEMAEGKYREGWERTGGI